MPDDNARPNGKSAWPEVCELDAAWSHRPRIAVISNPSASHIEVALAAARNGCDLFIEKPLSNSLDGCEELAEIVREKKLVAMIGCQYRFHPLLVRLRERLAAGKLGLIAGREPSGASICPIGIRGKIIAIATAPEPISVAESC